MNLPRITNKYPGADCRRIDLSIGENAYRGQGLGSEIIVGLTDFALNRERADLVFGCDIADYNVASLKAFQKAGYVIEAELEQPPGARAGFRYDLRYRQPPCNNP